MQEQPTQGPKQARSRSALERFIRAGEALLVEHRFESTGVAELAHAAGSSVGSFYRLVGDRDRLLCIIHDRFIERARGLLQQRLHPTRFESAPLCEVLRGFVSLLVEVYADEAGLLRALIIRSSADASFRARVHALNGHLEATLGVLVLPRRAEIGHPNPGSAFTFGAKVVLGALNHHTLVNSLQMQDSKSLVDELSRVLIRYLDVPEGDQ